MSVLTVSMLIVVTTFGLANVVDNLVEIGLAAVPSWIAVGLLYFLPLALILAEFASDTRRASGGIYSYMARGLGPLWAFVGTWSYFVANLVYLQSSFSRLPIRASLALTGRDLFDAVTVLLPLLGVGICLLLTWVSSRGVRVFSRLASVAGQATLGLLAVLVVLPWALWLGGRLEPATPIEVSAMLPSLDLQYFSTFAWLLFAVAGAEVAAPYVHQTDDPTRSVPRAILLSTLLIAGLYILATVAVALLWPVADLTKATGLYDLWLGWSALVGIEGEAVARVGMTIYLLGAVAAYVVWMESPLRAMFAEVPHGTFPEALTRRDADGTHHQALWTQAAVVCVLTLVPLLSIVTGGSGSERFIALLNDLASLSLVVPYVFIVLSYIRARLDGMDAPFKMCRSTPLAVAVGLVLLLVSGLGYLGAGLYALQAAVIDWLYVAIVYGGPLLLVGLGLGLRQWSMQSYRKRRGAT
jgi:amino acid transporter